MNRLVTAAVAFMLAISGASAQKSIDDAIDLAIASVEKSTEKDKASRVIYEVKRDPQSKKVTYSKVIIIVTDKKLGDKLEACFRAEREKALETKVSLMPNGGYQKLIFKNGDTRREYMLTSDPKKGSWTLIVRNYGDSDEAWLIGKEGVYSLGTADMAFVDIDGLRQQLQTGLSGMSLDLKQLEKLDALKNLNKLDGLERLKNLKDIDFTGKLSMLTPADSTVTVYDNGNVRIYTRRAGN